MAEYEKLFFEELVNSFEKLYSYILELEERIEQLEKKNDDDDFYYQEQQEKNS